MKATKDQIKGGLWGVVVGDALGVPVEFHSRLELKDNPITGMRGNGTHDQPPGTWSDDTSLTLCTVESLLQGFDVNDMGRRFIQWHKKGLWTPHGEVFDIGSTTAQALRKIENGIDPAQAGLSDEWSNGNGSLMRILPLAFILEGLPEEEKFERIRQVSSITHAHKRSVAACYIYAKFVEKLIETSDKQLAYIQMQNEVREFLPSMIGDDEYKHFYRVVEDDISTFPESEIYSSGYVVYTLEAALWSFLTTGSFEDAVLTAVNLGEDTDTTGAVTGGLAGTYYGYQAIPDEWINSLERRDEIEQLIERFAEKYGEKE